MALLPAIEVWTFITFHNIYRASAAKIQCVVAGRVRRRVRLAKTWWELTSCERLCISESSAAEFSPPYTGRHLDFSLTELAMKSEGKLLVKMGHFQENKPENRVTAQPDHLC